MRFIVWFLSLFRRHPELYLMHPEEAPDYSITLANASYSAVMQRWLNSYHVPGIYHDFWRYRIVVHVTTDIGVPAQTWDQDGMRHLAVRPEWLNPGVIAHEQAHNSYALLGETYKDMFAAALGPLKKLDPLVRYLFGKHPYGLSDQSEVEEHANIYRYLGPEQMPEVLRRYYPRLFVTYEFDGGLK